jgi:YihY family inner membrane protein
VTFFRRLVERFDAYQRRLRPIALPVAVVKRYGDDRGGQLAALVTFYGFLSLFPLLLLLITFAGLFLDGTSLQNDIVNSALAQFPVIGGTIRENLHAIARGNVAAVVVSVLGLLWGALGITNSLQSATARVYRLDASDEGPWWRRSLNGLTILTLLGVVVLLSSVAAGFSAFGASFVGGSSSLARILVVVLDLAVNLGGYVAVLWRLAPSGTALATLWPGAWLGALGWTALQGAGGYLLTHQLHHASQIYGFFAVVLGLILWISLGAQLFVYATELNVTLSRREWPRQLLAESSTTA